MTNETNLYDISAEFLLNYLHPDQMDQWEVDCAGTFYRNYSEDILAIDEEKGAVRLARDSFLRLISWQSTRRKEPYAWHATASCDCCPKA